MSGIHKAIFIDRDGVINQELSYVHKIQDFLIIPGVFDGLKILQDLGYLLVIITNQAGIAHGLYNQDDLNYLHDYMLSLFTENDINISSVYYCPHHPNGKALNFRKSCDCRKPSPGMILRACKDFRINLSSSYLIGDKISDIIAGQRAGITNTILVESGHAITDSDKLQASYVTSNLFNAALYIKTIDDLKQKELS